MARERRPFTPDGAGGYRLHFRRIERDLLQRLPRQALGLIEERHESTRRLFPVAYTVDPQADAEYQRSMGAELLAGRRHALETLADTAGREGIDGEQLELWLQAIEALRLVLGTQLDVSEDMAEPGPLDPRAPAFAVYQYLSALQDEAVGVLSERLPAVEDAEEELLALLADDDVLGSLAFEELWGHEPGGPHPGEPGGPDPGGPDPGGPDPGGAAGR